MSALPIQPAAAAASTGPDLRDIHLPPEPSWWPPAPGWWFLVVLLLAALLLGVWLWRRHRHVLRQREQVLFELDRLAHQHQQDSDQAALANGLHQLLRRVARRHDGMATQQRGEAWRQTLARVPVDAATLEQLLTLEQAIYRPQSTFDHVAAVTAVRQWLRLALKPAAWKPVVTERAHA
jgi:Tfp pilus assembly protein PilO